MVMVFVYEAAVSPAEPGAIFVSWATHNHSIIPDGQQINRPDLEDLASKVGSSYQLPLSHCLPIRSARLHCLILIPICDDLH